MVVEIVTFLALITIILHLLIWWQHHLPNSILVIQIYNTTIIILENNKFPWIDQSIQTLLAWDSLQSANKDFSWGILKRVSILKIVKEMDSDARFPCWQPVLVFLTCHINTLARSVLQWSNNTTMLRLFLLYQFCLAEICICHKPCLTRDELCDQQIAPPRTLMLSFLFNTSGIPHARHVHAHFELWGRPFCSSLLASFFLHSFIHFDVAMKGIYSTQLHCHISFLSFIWLTPVFYPAGDNR